MFDMISTVLKNLVSRPATRNYPKQAREDFEGARGRIEINIDDCIFCGMCGRKCPAKAIKVDRPSTTWEIDPYKCITCNACVEACPKKCLVMLNHRSPAAYGKKKLSFKKQAAEKDG